MASLWAPFSLRAFFEAHMPFAEAFNARRGVSFESVIAVAASVLFRATFCWRKDWRTMCRHWMRVSTTWVLFTDRVSLEKEIPDVSSRGPHFLAWAFHSLTKISDQCRPRILDRSDASRSLWYSLVVRPGS